MIEKDTKSCPFCAETIKAGATVCRYCLRDFSSDVSAVPIALRYHLGRTQVGWGLLAGLVIIAWIAGANHSSIVLVNVRVNDKDKEGNKSDH